MSEVKKLEDELATLNQEHDRLYERYEQLETLLAMEPDSPDYDDRFAESIKIPKQIDILIRRKRIIEQQKHDAEIDDFINITWSNECKAAASKENERQKVKAKLDKLKAQITELEAAYIAAENKATHSRDKLASVLRTAQDTLHLDADDLQDCYAIHDKHNLASPIRYWPDHPTAIELKRRQAEVVETREREARERAERDRAIWEAKRAKELEQQRQ